MKKNQDVLVLTPPGFCDASLAIAASRAGGCGVLDLEFVHDPSAALAEIGRLQRFAKNPYGVKIASCSDELLERVEKRDAPSLQRL